MGNNIKFGTDGWRAKIADQFTFKNVELVTKAIIKYFYDNKLNKKPVLISYDTRFMANRFAEKTAQIISEYGIEARITDRDTPTPVLAHSIINQKAAGSINFTASHNSYDYCGYKFMPHYGGPATVDITSQIVENIKLIDKEPNKHLKKISKKGKLSTFNPKEAYIKSLSNIINFEVFKNYNFDLIYDPMFSTGRGYLDEILKQAGCKIKVINNYPNPLFNGQRPDPKIEYLRDITTYVKENNGAIGLATDGDADRYGFINEKANYVDPNLVFAMLMNHLLKNKKQTGSIVRTVATTHLIDLLAEKYNLKVHETPVGFKYVGEIMRKEKVLIGGEESAGLSVQGHIPQKDGILVILLVLEYMAHEKLPLYKLQEQTENDIGQQSYYDRIDLIVESRVKQEFVEYLGNNPPEKIDGNKLIKISKIDGTKLYYEDNSWILTRPSGTEPLLRIYFETSSIEKMTLMIKLMKDMVNTIINK